MSATVAKLCPHRISLDAYCARCAEPHPVSVTANPVASRAHAELIPGATETGLSLPDHLTEEEWRSVGSDLGRVQRASQWWVGDWINYAEVKWGEKYEEAQAITGLNPNYLRPCAMVAARFGLLDRSNKLILLGVALVGAFGAPGWRR